MILTIIAFILIFGLLVFVHEFGHFVAAKFFGVRVDEFAFGFPPRIWAKKKGGTTYALNAIPIGGYVKLRGEEGEGNRKDSKNYLSKKPWQRAIILVSGVFMNLVLAYLLLVGFYVIGGQALFPGMDGYKNVSNTQKVMISDIVNDSPAKKEGLAIGDVIKKVEGRDVANSNEVIAIIQQKIEKDQNAKIELIISKDLGEISKNIGTYSDKITENGKTVEYRRIGISMANEGKVQAKWWAAPFVAARELWALLVMIVSGLGKVVHDSVTKLRISDDVGGPVAIFMVTGTAVQMGFSILVQVVVALSLTLAVMNILPLPALDGGHVLFLLIEKIRGKEVPGKVKETVNTVGFYLLIILIIAITFKDLFRFGIFKQIKEWLS